MSKKRKGKTNHNINNVIEMRKIRKEIKNLENSILNATGNSLDSNIIQFESNKILTNVSNTVEKYLTKTVLVNPVQPTDSIHEKVSVPTANAIGDVSLVEKPYVYGYCSNYGESTIISISSLFNSINTMFGNNGKIQCVIQNNVVTQEDVLPFVRAFWFRNPFELNRMYEIYVYKKYQKRYQYKIIAEVDEYVFEYPSWHSSSKSFTIGQSRILISNLRNVDEVLVYSNSFKNALIDLGVNTPITVIQRLLPISCYGTDVTRRFRTSDIHRPVVLFSGNNSDFRESVGDFDDSVVDFILRNVNNIDFIFIGVSNGPDGMFTIPSRIQQLALKGIIRIMPKYTATEYPYALRQILPDFVVAPLRKCVYNTTKDDLRYLESAAVGAIFIGQKFDDGTSPYQSIGNGFNTGQDIENMINRFRDKELFNAELDIQYSYLSTRTVEDVNNLLNFVKLFGNGIKGVIGNV